MSTFPRILVVAACPFGSDSGTGTTLQAMFAEWPRDALSQLHFDLATEDCAIESHRVRAMPSLRRARRMYQAAVGRVRPPSPPSEQGSAVPHRHGGASARRWGSAATDLIYRPDSDDMDEFICRVRPQVVYTLLGSVAVGRVALRAAEVADAPLVTHFMDDWLATRYSRGELLGVADRTLHETVRRAVLAPGGNLAISPKMADEYARDFGRPFEVAGNCIPDHRISDRPDVRADGKALDLVYFGGLHLGRGRVLERLADVLHESGLGRLHVFAPLLDLKATRLIGHPAVAEATQVRPQAMASKVAQADVAVHVESSDPEAAAFTRLSLSTKIPGYLAAGRPVLAICPRGLASGEYLETSGAGLVSDGDPDHIRAALQRLTEPAVRLHMASAGLARVRASHTLEATTETLLRAAGVR